MIYNFHFNLLYFRIYANPRYETWDENLRDAQLHANWGNSQSNPMTKIVCGVGRATYVICNSNEEMWQSRLPVQKNLSKLDD